MKRHSFFLIAAFVASTFQTQAQGFPGGGFGGFGGFPEGGFPGFPGMDGDFGGFGGFGGGFDMSAMPEGPTGHVDFESSNLPVIQIFTDSLKINKQSKITARMKITDNGTGKRNTVQDAANNYDGYIGIKIRGNSSAAFTQKRFTIETRTAEGKDQKASLLGMPADEDWVLLGPYNDRSMMRDAFAFDLWTQMGHWGSRSRYAEVLINGEYRGVYLLCEKIKRSTDRVNIAKSKKNKENGELDVTGGYLLRIDAADGDEFNFRSTIDGVGSAGGFGGFGGFGGGFGDGFGGFGGGFPGMPGNAANADHSGQAGNAQPTFQHPVTWSVFYPKKDSLLAEQQTYIQDYIAKAEQAIADGKDYEKYIDVASFVDYFIHTELSLNADGFKRSAYFYKDQGGLLQAGPVWDYNLAYGNCNFCSAGDPYAWVYNGCETNPTPAMWKNLAQDKAFMTKVKKRYTQLRKDILSDKAVLNYVSQHAELLQEAQQRHFTKYPTLLEGGTVPENENAGQAGNTATSADPGNAGFGGFGGFGGGGGDTSWFDAYTPKDYADEIQTLSNWLTARLAFLDEHWK